VEDEEGQKIEVLGVYPKDMKKHVDWTNWIVAYQDASGAVKTKLVGAEGPDDAKLALTYMKPGVDVLSVSKADELEPMSEPEDKGMSKGTSVGPSMQTQQVKKAPKGSAWYKIFVETPEMPGPPMVFPLLVSDDESAVKAGKGYMKNKFPAVKYSKLWAEEDSYESLKTEFPNTKVADVTVSKNKNAFEEPKEKLWDVLYVDQNGDEHEGKVYAFNAKGAKERLMRLMRASGYQVDVLNVAEHDPDKFNEGSTGRFVFPRGWVIGGKFVGVGSTDHIEWLGNYLSKGKSWKPNEVWDTACETGCVRLAPATGTLGTIHFMSYPDTSLLQSVQDALMDEGANVKKVIVEYPGGHLEAEQNEFVTAKSIEELIRDYGFNEGEIVLENMLGETKTVPLPTNNRISEQSVTMDLAKSDNKPIYKVINSSLVKESVTEDSAYKGALAKAKAEAKSSGVAQNLFYSDEDESWEYVTKTSATKTKKAAWSPVYVVEPDGTATLTEEQHSYACLMAGIPEDLRAELLALHEKIDPDDVDPDDGLETDPHVTVLYGMIDEDLDAVHDVLKSAGKVPCKIIGVDVFENDDKDVLVLRVESDKLTELHDELLAATDAHQTFSEYKPHITIGYLNKGAAGRYKDLVEGTIGA